ncbi:MAG: hypothetical protein JHD16_17665, partial [Solirubrobacteraceae bacterium]|nr:hypothetical protein [Solirubrobacteraceae bacterium]
LAQREQRPPPLDRLVTGVPPYVASAVARALSYDPAERPATALELRELLFGADPTQATRIGAAAEDATGVTEYGEPTGKTRVSRRAALTAGLAASDAGATSVQRIQPRPASGPAPAGGAPGAPATRGPSAPAGRGPAAAPKAAKAARPKRSAGARFMRAAVVGAIFASAGGVFGFWLSDQMSGIDVTTGGGDLPTLVEDFRGALGQ